MLAVQWSICLMDTLQQKLERTTRAWNTSLLHGYNVVQPCTRAASMGIVLTITLDVQCLCCRSSIVSLSMLCNLVLGCSFVRSLRFTALQDQWKHRASEYLCIHLLVATIHSSTARGPQATPSLGGGVICWRSGALLSSGIGLRNGMLVVLQMP
jgi:hypothetical protein